MWEPQPLATLRDSTACTGITLPTYLFIWVTIFITLRVPGSIRWCCPQGFLACILFEPLNIKKFRPSIISLLSTLMSPCICNIRSLDPPIRRSCGVPWSVLRNHRRGRRGFHSQAGVNIILKYTHPHNRKYREFFISSTSRICTLFHLQLSCTILRWRKGEEIIE
jgi:hypothetical protein